MSATTSPVNRQIVLQNGHFPHGNILAAGYKSLVLGQPVVPLRAGPVGWLNGAMPVGNRIRRIAHVAGCGRRGGRAPAQQAIAVQIKAVGAGSTRRKVPVVLPGVGASLIAGRILRDQTRPRPSNSAQKTALRILRAKLLADGLAVIQIPQPHATRKTSIHAATGPSTRKFSCLRIVRLQPRVLLLRPPHIFLVVVAAHGKRGHGNRVEVVLHARATTSTWSYAG